MNDKARFLLEDLRELHKELSELTISRYNRINPFCEDLFSWKERGEYWLGEDKGVTIYNSTTVVGDVKIGDNTWIGPMCSLDGTGDLTIGSYCVISAGCQIQTHDTIKWALSGGLAKYEYSPVRIGNYCFLGVHSIVLKGVTIGEYCVIGAGAVVTKNIPSHSIVVGVPARSIGSVLIDKRNNIKFKYNKKVN